MLDKAVQAAGAELEAEIKETIIKSTPLGRTYRRAAITKRASKANLAIGLKRSRKNSSRVVAGSEFHRASRRGQPPARDTGQLINSIRARRSGMMRTTVAAGVRYAEILDDPKRLDRPFFQVTAKAFVPKFKDKIRAIIKAG